MTAPDSPTGLVSRRTVTRAAAIGWTAPVILAAVAAPAAAASQTVDPQPCVDPVGLGVKPQPGSDWNENSGDGFTTVKGGDGVVLTNTSDTPITVLLTFWTSAHQEGVRLVGGTGDTLIEAPKDGNRASIPVLIGANDQREVRVAADRKSAEAHLIVGCGGHGKAFNLKASVVATA